MSQIVEVSVREMIVSNGSFGPREIDQLSNALSTDYRQFQVLKDAVAELESNTDRPPASSVRLGVGVYFLGRYADAAQILSNADGGALAHFYLGRSQYELEQYTECIGSYN